MNRGVNFLTGMHMISLNIHDPYPEFDEPDDLWSWMQERLVKNDILCIGTLENL